MSSLDDVHTWLSENSFSPNTEERYLRALKRLSEAAPDLAALSASDLRLWLDAQGWGSSGRWVAFCAVRGFLRWKFGKSHPALALKIKRQDSGPQRTLKKKQVQDLLSCFDTSTPKGIRDLAICALMLDSGLRASEVCRLEVRHVDLEERSFQVIVKGGKWADGVFSSFTARYLSNWLAIRNDFAEPVIKTFFVGIGGNKPGTSLTRTGLQVIFRTWGKRSGIGSLSPHDLRRTFATLATRAGAPGRVLQAAGRWSNITMVERYTRAINAVDFEPYFPVSNALD